MNIQKFEEYCKEYNTGGNKVEFFDRYYDPEAVFEHPIKGTFKGKKAIVGFWTKGHQGIREVLKPLNVLSEGNQFAAEVRVEWHCLHDTDYLGFRKKGKVYLSECAGFFHLKSGRIIRAKMYLNEFPTST